MKRSIVVAFIGVAATLSLTGCGLFNKDDPTSETTTIQLQTETETQTASNFDVYDDTNSYYEEDNSTEEFQADSSVYTEAMSMQYYSMSDTISVALTEPTTQENVSANFSITHLYSGADADQVIDDYNKNTSGSYEISDPTDGTEYKVIDFTLYSPEFNTASVSSDLACSVVGINADTPDDAILHFNNQNYSGGSVIFTKSATLQPNTTITGQLVYCVPTGCTSYGLQLGDNESIVIPEDASLVATLNNAVSSTNYDVSGAYLD